MGAIGSIKKVCAVCGKDFRATLRYPGRKCCGKACAEALRSKARIAGRDKYYAETKKEDLVQRQRSVRLISPLVSKECVMCHKVFLGPNTTDGRRKKCCSPECTYKLRFQNLERGRSLESFKKNGGCKKGVPWSAARRAAAPPKVVKKKVKRRVVRKKVVKRKVVKKKVIRVCSSCGTKLLTRHSTAKFCSNACAAKGRSLAAAKKKKANKEVWLSEEDSMAAAVHNMGIMKEYRLRIAAGEDVVLVMGEKSKYYISAPGNPTKN